jgi:hypothetical protein
MMSNLFERVLQESATSRLFERVLREKDDTGIDLQIIRDVQTHNSSGGGNKVNAYARVLKDSTGKQRVVNIVSMSESNFVYVPNDDTTDPSKIMTDAEHKSVIDLVNDQATDNLAVILGKTSNKIYQAALKLSGGSATDPLAPLIRTLERDTKIIKMSFSDYGKHLSTKAKAGGGQEQSNRKYGVDDVVIEVLDQAASGGGSPQL